MLRLIFKYLFLSSFIKFKSIIQVLGVDAINRHDRKAGIHFPESSVAAVSYNESILHRKEIERKKPTPQPNRKKESKSAKGMGKSLPSADFVMPRN